MSATDRDNGRDWHAGEIVAYIPCADHFQRLDRMPFVFAAPIAKGCHDCRIEVAS